MNSPLNIEPSALNQALDVRIDPELFLKWQTILNAAQIETLVTTSQLKIEFTSANQDQYQQLQTFVENHHTGFVESNQWQLYLATAFIEIDHPPTNLKMFAPWIVCPLTITFSDHTAHFQIENPALNEQLLTKLQDLNRSHKLVFEVPKIDQSLVTTINNNPSWNLSQIYQSQTDFSLIAPLGNQISFKPHQNLLIINFNPQRSHLGVQLTKLRQSWPDYENQLLNNGSFDPHVAKQKIIDLMIDQRGQYLYKIMPTNYSQDCAILSALNFHTFIDGPPGTGKTQCLTNLLVNIMLNQATAIVSSQKQVALDILSDKLEILNTFVLHLNKNFLIKSNFYHHIRQSLHSAWQYQPQIQPLQKTFNYDQREWLMIDQAYNKRHDQSAIDQNSHEWFEKNIQYESTFTKWLEVNHFEINPQNPNHNNEVPKQRRRWWKRNQDQQSQQVLEQNHPRYQQYLAFQAVFPSAAVYQDQYQLYQYWNTTLNQAQSQGDQKINAIENVYQQIQKNIGLQLKAIDQDPQLQGQYFEFMSHLKSEVLPPLKFLNQYQNIIKILFPIIFTLPTIDLSFFQVQSFTYSIIDEASQLSKDAGFVLLALGKIRVLAGDEAQLPPIHYFQKAINDPQWGKIESILQYAKTMPIHHIPLELTYRAQWAQLMTFNAHHFYHDQLFISDVFQYQTNNSLIVKTIDASAIVKNLAAFKANPEQSEAKLYQQILKSFPHANFWELRAISSYLVKFCFDKNPDQTYQLKPLNNQVKIIVILANQVQQNALEKYLKLKFKNRLDHLQAQNLLIIKNLTNIQGIEADIVIFGITYSPQTKFNMSIFGKKWGQNALNVATSRAKKQMVVIKSISPYDIDLVSAGADLQIFQKFLMFLEQTNVQRTLYHYQMHKLNLLNPQLKHYQLKQQIKSQIEPLIINSNLQLFDDYYLATIKCDLALVDPDRNLAIALFMINEYDDLQTYWIVKDRIIYLKHRHFNVLVINEQTNWDLVENEVAQIISYYHAKKHLIKIQSFTNEAKTHLPMRLEEITGNLDDNLLFALDETLKKK